MEDGGQFTSGSGIPIKPVYTPEDVTHIDYHEDIGLPGRPPFTRGVYPTMYRGKLWTIRQYSGVNTPEETNALYRREYELGQTGFSVATDVPTGYGLDWDDPTAFADVGDAGVPISSLEDMETTFEGLPINKIATALEEKIENMGGTIQALSSGWVHQEYRDAMLEHERKVTCAETIVVGVNKFRLEKEPYQVPIFRPNPKSPEIQIKKLQKLKRERDNARVIQALHKLEEVSRSEENVMPAVVEAVKAYTSIGEITNVWRKVYGV